MQILRPARASHLWRVVALSLLLVSSARVLAQRFEARLFGQAEGLGNLSVLALAQDGNQYLWVATENGLFRYDGAHFTEFGRSDGLSEPVAFTLLVDHQGRLWAGTHAGLYWFDGQRFQEVRLAGKSVHVGMNSMLAATPAGEVIAQGSTGLVSVEVDEQKHGWVAMPYGRRHPHTGDLGDTNGIGVDGDGHFVLGCDNAICVHAEDGRRFLGPEQGVPPDYYVSIFRAHNGRMWARGRKHIVTWLPASKTPASEPEQVTDVTALFPPGALTTIYRRFTEDQFGNILTPTAQGFATWDGHGWVETRATSSGPLEGATDLFVDREGAVWIGTEGSGLLESLGYRQWENFGTAEGLSSAHVYAIERDTAGRVWIGGNQGTSILAPGSTSPMPSPLDREPDAKDLHSFAATADGGMWAATELGHIYRVTAAGAIDYRGEIDAYVRAMRLDAEGILWLATSGGVFTLRCPPRQPCSGVPRHYDQLAKDSLYDIAIEPGGRVWTVGQHGLSSMEGDRVCRVTVEGGEIAQDFASIAIAADGTLWLGGQTPGVLHVRLTGDARARVIGAYTRPQLSSDVVNFLRFDHSGQLWIGTDKGVSVIRGADAQAPGAVRSITADDGLIWNNTGNRAFVADEDGSVWIGTSGGVSHLLHPRAVLERPPFAASISQANYGQQAVPLTIRSSTPWVNGATVIDFSGLTFRGNQSLVYHYRLLGFDATPVTTRTPFVRFQKLPPGDYRMRVVAEDPAHGVFSSPAELAFSLTPPWWRTWSFEAMLAVITLLLLVRIWRWSHLALLAQRQKLERLVAERTHELEEMAVRDGLTGLLNRNAILDRLNAELHDARLKKQALCVALIDLDHFKRVNDTHGHLAGDAVLRHSAQRLQAAVRANDVVGRYGGEEFIVIFKDVDRAFGAERCERVREALCSEPIAFEDLRLTVTCSIGFACTLDEGPQTAKLIARADEAMYQAKHGGRNRVVCSVAA